MADINVKELGILENSESEWFSPYRSDGKLYGFVCVVTGATQPIGKAIVSELAAHGAACIYACTSISDEPDTNLADEVNAKFPNTKVIGYPIQITSEEDTLTLIDDVLNQWGRLDIWTSSTGHLGPPNITSTSTPHLLTTFQTNSMPPFFALKHAPAAMQKTTPKGTYPNAAPKDRPYGSIIVITSIASHIGGCWGPAFTMSSHAALGVVRAGVAVLKGTGVRINCISAGQIDVGVDLAPLGTATTSTSSSSSPNNNNRRQSTVERGQLPPSSLQSTSVQKMICGLERAGRPEEIARVAGFLASGFSSFMTGANLVVDGGAAVMNPLTVPV